MSYIITSAVSVFVGFIGAWLVFRKNIKWLFPLRKLTAQAHVILDEIERDLQ